MGAPCVACGLNPARLLAVYQRPGDTPYYCSVKCAVETAMDYAERGWDRDLARRDVARKLRALRDGNPD